MSTFTERDGRRPAERFIPQPVGRGWGGGGSKDAYAKLRRTNPQNLDPTADEAQGAAITNRR